MISSIELWLLNCWMIVVDDDGWATRERREVCGVCKKQVSQCQPSNPLLLVFDFFFSPPCMMKWTIFFGECVEDRQLLKNLGGECFLLTHSQAVRATRSTKNRSSSVPCPPHTTERPHTTPPPTSSPPHTPVFFCFPFSSRLFDFSCVAYSHHYFQLIYSLPSVYLRSDNAI